MRCEILHSEDAESYDALVEECGTIFHTRQWVNALGAAARLLGIYADDGALVGGILVGEYRISGFRVLRPLPFTPVSGPFLMHRAKSVVKRADEVRRAAMAVLEWIESRRPALTMLTLSPEYTDTISFTRLGYKVLPRYTYRIDLSLTEEELAANLSSHRRKAIRSADRDGLSIRPGAAADSIARLQLKSLRRQGVSTSIETMYAVMTRGVNAHTSYSFTCYRAETPIATAFVVHDTRTAYYVMGGYDTADSHTGAGPAVLWSSILHAKRLGLSVFDFEGSCVPSVERYFREFGGELTVIPSINKAWLPIEVALKLYKRSMF